MASSAASLLVAPENMSFELTCHDWIMKKLSWVLEDELIEDVLGQSILASSTLSVIAWKVNAPIWLQRAYCRINSNLQCLVTAIQNLLDEHQDPHQENRFCLWSTVVFCWESLAAPEVPHSAWSLCGRISVLCAPLSVLRHACKISYSSCITHKATLHPHVYAGGF